MAQLVRVNFPGGDKVHRLYKGSNLGEQALLFNSDW